MNSVNRRLIVAGCLVVSTACGGEGGSPTQPSPSTPPPPPAAQTFTLSGTVTEAIPTTNVTLANVRVEIVDTSHAGKVSITNGAGAYSIPNLSGELNVRYTLAGYMEVVKGRNMNQAQTLTVGLLPTPQNLTEEYTGSVSGGDTTCSDGIFTKPCKVITLNIHHGGAVDAVLTWSGNADLDLTLASGSTIIASSRGVGSTEHVSSGISGGTSYQLRVTYYGGSTIASYRVRVTRPN